MIAVSKMMHRGPSKKMRKLCKTKMLRKKPHSTELVDFKKVENCLWAALNPAFIRSGRAPLHANFFLKC